MDHSKEGKRNQKLTDLKRCCFVVVCSFVVFGRGGVRQGRWGGGGVESRSRPGVTSPIGLDHITGATVHTTYCLKPF